MSATFSAPGWLSAAVKSRPSIGAVAEDLEEVLRRVRARVALRVPVHGHVDRRPVEVRRQQVERLLERHQLLVVHRRGLAVHAEEVLARRVDEVHADQAVGGRKREAAQHHPVDDAELGRDGRDAEGEDDDGQRAEGFFLDEHAEADAEVLEKGFGKHIRDLRRPFRPRGSRTGAAGGKGPAGGKAGQRRRRRPRRTNHSTTAAGASTSAMNCEVDSRPPNTKPRSASPRKYSRMNRATA